ncbi:putative chitinase [Paraburkholderia tropica]|uniref:Chitinase n=1 Tax=Paraburkholderia tropica TaxID=92647 RepID=A0ABX5MNN9_9BURK|nr:glycoside hydrolase family 19 protein [Paraburkholderia tropica]PXX15845.1 putative chitinase [Paraburkholderia tropica]PZW82104.1 putative chitinase [Paraburkholderia tropica]
MTPDLLAQCLGIPVTRAETWSGPLSAAAALYAIDSPARLAAFIAQIGHESGKFIFLVELWGPTSAQAGYEPPSVKARDLGNTHGGDGFRYRGRGLIQITGRANYQKCGDALGMDLIASPELLATPSNAALSAAWFWNEHGLNDLADAGDFETITRRINGGLTGIADREALWKQAKAALGVDESMELNGAENASS